MRYGASKFLPCTSCRGERLHHIGTRKIRKTGQVVRVWICSACERRKPVAFVDHPGLVCPACGDCRMSVHYTTSAVRTLATLRVRRCRHCGHRIRTVERIECANVR